MILFVETSGFTKYVTAYLSDEEVNALQLVLLENPEAGDVIKGSGGIRKIRHGGKGKGKRGGYRVIYYIPDEGRPDMAAYHLRQERDGRPDGKGT